MEARWDLDMGGTLSGHPLVDSRKTPMTGSALVLDTHRLLVNVKPDASHSNSMSLEKPDLVQRDQDR